MNPTALEIGLIVGLIWLASLTAVVWAHFYEDGYFLRKKIARQERYVAELAVAYENHPFPGYKARLERETAKLEAMRGKL